MDQQGASLLIGAAISQLAAELVREFKWPWPQATTVSAARVLDHLATCMHEEPLQCLDDLSPVSLGTWAGASSEDEQAPVPGPGA